MRRIEILPLANFGIGSAILTNHDGIIPEDLLLLRSSCAPNLLAECNDDAVNIQRESANPISCTRQNPRRVLFLQVPSQPPLVAHPNIGKVKRDDTLPVANDILTSFDFCADRIADWRPRGSRPGCFRFFEFGVLRCCS
jgi:hypothetical protein